MALQVLLKVHSEGFDADLTLFCHIFPDDMSTDLRYIYI